MKWPGPIVLLKVTPMARKNWHINHRPRLQFEIGRPPTMDCKSLCLPFLILVQHQWPLNWALIMPILTWALMPQENRRKPLPNQAMVICQQSMTFHRGLYMHVHKAERVQELWRDYKAESADQPNLHSYVSLSDQPKSCLSGPRLPVQRLLLVLLAFLPSCTSCQYTSGLL